MRHPLCGHLPNHFRVIFSLLATSSAVALNTGCDLAGLVFVVNSVAKVNVHTILWLSKRNKPLRWMRLTCNTGLFKSTIENVFMMTLTAYQPSYHCPCIISAVGYVLAEIPRPFPVFLNSFSDGRLADCVTSLASLYV
jgi:hypothetical protein